jgi:hypothetical protein
VDYDDPAPPHRDNRTQKGEQDERQMTQENSFGSQSVEHDRVKSMRSLTTLKKMVFHLRIVPSRERNDNLDWQYLAQTSILCCFVVCLGDHCK